MKLINIICYFIISSNAFGQIIHLQTNLSGKYIVTCNEANQEFIEVLSKVYTKINLCDTFEIEYLENKATIIYRFYNVQFSENDTISLDFMQYYSADRINYCSGCIDGTESKSTIEIIELNNESKPIIQLPEKIFIKLNSNELVLIKNEEDIILINTGNGKKLGKKWGFTKSTFSKKVIYSNLN